jgi:hypothetical protein
MNKLIIVIKLSKIKKISKRPYPGISTTAHTTLEQDKGKTSLYRPASTAEEAAREKNHRV